MFDPEYIRRILAEHCSLHPVHIAITPLSGDASNRSYYRLHWGGLSPQKEPLTGTLVLMKLEAPEAFKASEEAVSGRVEIDELPFVNVQRHLFACGVAVPRIYHYDREAGIVFLEDLGDFTFAQAISGRPREVLARLYRRAIDELLKIQQKGSIEREPRCIVFDRAFDVGLLMWEFDHFLEYGIEKPKNVEIAAAAKEEIRAFFLDIATILAAQPRTFTHRDYHSRNLMLEKESERVMVLDFQDALMGPPHYDLASLLRDSYVALPEELIDELIGYYLDARERAEGRPTDKRKFRELFDLASIQRNLKAAGRFGYIHLVKGNSRYLASIPPTLAHVKKNLQKYSRLSRLGQLLSDDLPELQ